MSNTNRVYRLAKRPEGTPDHDTFELSEEEIPEPGPGEVLIKTLYLSVDPYMRDRMRDSESYEEPWDVGDALMGAGAVRSSNPTAHGPTKAMSSQVSESGRSTPQYLDRYSQRSTPISHDFDGTRLLRFRPDSVLSVPGQSTACGRRHVRRHRGRRGRRLRCGPARQAQGARVVGFAGSDEKVSFLEDDLGFDVGINYKTTDDYRAALDEAAPDGVDAYSTTSANRLPTRCAANTDARVAVADRSRCNSEEIPMGPRKLTQVIQSRATVEGLLVSDSSRGSRKRRSSSVSGSPRATSPIERPSPKASRTRPTRSSGCSG